MTTNQRRQLRNKLTTQAFSEFLFGALKAAMVFFLAQQRGFWPLAVLLVAGIELWRARPGGPVAAGNRRAAALDRVPAIVVGVSAAVIIAVAPRLATQVAVAVLYGLWRVWWRPSATSFIDLLIMQAVWLEALFLTAAIWRTPHWAVLSLIWVGTYLSVYAFLVRRGERAASVMAATWALTCVQIAWVLLLWLFTYAMSGGYLLVPQPALILTALAYCFGSIYISQRQGTLSRGRLTEYLLIGLIMIAIVAVGTSWRGTV